jgi:choline dehydrogenase
MSSKNENQIGMEFAKRVRVNQRRLRSSLKSHYDVIVCGAGSSGCVVARRMAENPDVNVLLLEAGGDDDVPSVTEANRWFENLGTERDWNFTAQPNPQIQKVFDETSKNWNSDACSPQDCCGRACLRRKWPGRWACIGSR